ncbi:hypothetical protein ACFLQ7_00065 [Actinomycetota bacterium]|jgi:predicted exporter
MSDRKLPLGISIITILMFIGAILDIAAGVFMLIETGPVAEAADISESTITGYAIGLLVAGVIIALLAFGLRSGSNGVRLLIGVVMALRIIFSIYAIIALPASRFEGLVTGVLAVVILYFLYGNEDSKAFFEA